MLIQGIKQLRCLIITFVAITMAERQDRELIFPSSREASEMLQGREGEEGWWWGKGLSRTMLAASVLNRVVRGWAVGDVGILRDLLRADTEKSNSPPKDPYFRSSFRYAVEENKEAVWGERNATRGTSEDGPRSKPLLCQEYGSRIRPVAL